MCVEMFHDGIKRRDCDYAQRTSLSVVLMNLCNDAFKSIDNHE